MQFIEHYITGSFDYRECRRVFLIFLEGITNLLVLLESEKNFLFITIVNFIIIEKKITKKQLKLFLLEKFHLKMSINLNEMNWNHKK